MLPFNTPAPHHTRCPQTACGYSSSCSIKTCRNGSQERLRLSARCPIDSILALVAKQNKTRFDIQKHGKSVTNFVSAGARCAQVVVTSLLVGGHGSDANNTPPTVAPTVSPLDAHTDRFTNSHTAVPTGVLGELVSRMCSDMLLLSFAFLHVDFWRAVRKDVCL